MPSDHGTSQAGTGTPYLAAVFLAAVACGTEPREANPSDFAHPDSAPTPTTATFITSSSSAEALFHYRLGIHAIDIELEREARENFALAAQADPSFALAHLGLALTATTPEAAARNLRLAARAADDVSEGERLRIAIGAEGWNGNLLARLDLAWQLANLHPTEPRAWRILAGARAALNQVEASREALRRAEALESDSPATLVALARSYMTETPFDLELAADFARRATVTAPDVPSLHVLLGDVLLAQGGMQEARIAFERAAALSPASPRVLARRGYMLALEGRYDSARESFDAAIALADREERMAVEVARAVVHVYADEPQAAVDELFDVADAWDTVSVSLAERDEFQIRALTPAAKIAMHHGLFTVAGRALERRARLVRRQVERVASAEFRRQQETTIAYLNALLAAHRGNEDDARAEVERLESLVEERATPRRLEPAMEVLGLISLRAGEFRKAASYFERTDLRNPHNRWQLGQALRGAGDAEAAAALLEDLGRADIESVEFALVGLDAIRPVP